MTPDETVTRFLDFYRERGHLVVPSSSLLPSPQDRVLFTTSGMHPLTPYLDGVRHPLGRRLVGVQRCLRTTDLDEVGDDWHLTVFEMLGTWSLGDYDGSQSLHWGYQLLREVFGLTPGELHVTVFGGDDQVGLDTESLRVWEQLGIPVELTVEDNWWSNGPTGPCGPDSEIFVWTGSGSPSGTPTSDTRWVEIGNHVMMRFSRGDDGTLRPLTQPNVDTGVGLERLVGLMQGRRSVFETEIFRPWVDGLPSTWDLDRSSRHLVVDHLRSGLVVVGEGVRPSNTGRGYVLRRLVRRTLTTLWRGDPSRTLGDLPLGPMEETLHRLGLPSDPVPLLDVLIGEEDRFRRLLDRGRQVVRQRLTRGPLTDDDYRFLSETHGLPSDLVQTLLSETG